MHKGGHIYCPAYDKVCSCCHKVGHFARVCRSRQRPHQQVPLNDTSQPTANAIHLQSPQGDHIQLYNITGRKAEPAPTISVQMISSKRTALVTVLPDSGADISAAGQRQCQHIGTSLRQPETVRDKSLNC